MKVIYDPQGCGGVYCWDANGQANHHNPIDPSDPGAAFRLAREVWPHEKLTSSPPCPETGGPWQFSVFGYKYVGYGDIEAAAIYAAIIEAKGAKS